VWNKVNQLFSSKVGGVVDDVRTFPILDILIRSGDIRNQSRARFAGGLRGFDPGWKNRDSGWRTSPKMQQGSHFDPRS